VGVALKGEGELRQGGSICPHDVNTLHFNDVGRIILNEKNVVALELRRRDIHQITVWILLYAVMLADQHVIECPDCPAMHSPSTLRHGAVLCREMAKIRVVTVIRIVQMQRGAGKLKPGHKVLNQWLVDSRHAGLDLLGHLGNCLVRVSFASREDRRDQRLV
jgi:hypothetical protein